MSHKTDKKNTQKGQILLITVMLLATAITVVMTISFSSTTETQVTKMEEESQKALSAAQAGIEAAIQKRGNIRLQTDLPSFQSLGITGQADIVEVGGNEFVTPLLQRDEQYFFYLDKYNQPDFSTQPADYWKGQLYMYFQSEDGQYPALELSFVAADNSITRYLIDPGKRVVNTDKTDTNVIFADLTSPTESIGDQVENIRFAYRTKQNEPALAIASDYKLVIVKVLNAATRIGFKGRQIGNWTNKVNLRSQGRKITSQAKTASGVSKTIELFQSYPQIPSDFYVTSF